MDEILLVEDNPDDVELTLMQSLCAMSHLDFRQKATHDYHQFFQTIRQLDIGAAALGQGFRRMAFNVMARNCDDHTKNFAFLLAEDGRWQLAPAYDVTLAYNPRGEWTSQHQMSVNGRFAEITRADLLVVADRFGIASATRSLNAVRDAVAGWPDCARQAGLDKPDIRRVAQLHRSV